MDNDLNDILNNFSDILKEKNIDINNIKDTFQNNQNIETSSSTNCNSINSENIISDNSTANNNDFTLDIETILKIKELINKINKNQNSPRNKLLESLKPFLENTKQEKLERYIKIANLLSVLEEMDIGLSFLENKQGYDFILIITLFLLII